MKTYRELLTSKTHNAVNKWSHYPEIYDEIFAPYRDNCNAVLEIGVQNGGSLQMLAEMFPTASVLGLDVNEACNSLNGTLGSRISVTIGDATNLNLLATLPTFDVIIDDGSHIPQMQAVSFAYLFKNKLSSNGIYVVEDLEHSFYDWWRSQPWFALDSFVDFIRDRIDDMHVAYVNGEKAKSNPYSLRIRKIQIYHGICAFFKSESLEIPRNQWWEGKRIL